MHFRAAGRAARRTSAIPLTVDSPDHDPYHNPYQQDHDIQGVEWGEHGGILRLVGNLSYRPQPFHGQMCSQGVGETLVGGYEVD